MRGDVVFASSPDRHTERIGVITNVTSKPKRNFWGCQVRFLDRADPHSNDSSCSYGTTEFFRHATAEEKAAHVVPLGDASTEDLHEPTSMLRVHVVVRVDSGNRGVVFSRNGSSYEYKVWMFEGPQKFTEVHVNKERLSKSDE